MVKRNVVLLVSHPDGEPKMSDYKVVEEELGELEDGLVRVETQYVSVDPYLRGKNEIIKIQENHHFSCLSFIR